MKKKAVVAMLVMCMTLSAAACGEKKSADKAQSSTEAADTAEEKTDTAKKDQNKSSVRLVSVDDVSKYITVGEYKGLALDKVVTPVSDTDIQAEIEYRLSEKAEEVKDGTVEMGDQVRINFTGTIDGKAFEGGTEEDYDMVVGAGGIADGFDDAIVGMKKGETKEVDITFPEDYYDSELAGKAAVYQVTMQKISRAPQLTDEWVAANTDYKTVDEYKASVGKELEADADEAAENQLYYNAWYAVLDSSEIKEYPEKDVEKAVEAYKELNGEYLEQAQMDMSEFLKSQGITEEEYEKECRQYAEAKVKQNLIVQYIMDQEGLSLEDEETKNLQPKLLQQYGVTELSELTDFYGQTEVNESLALLRVQKFIADNAQIDQKVGTGDDLAENEDAYTADSVYSTDGETDVVDAGTDAADEGTEAQTEGTTDTGAQDDQVVEE